MGHANWMCGGDFNNSPDDVGTDWLHSIGGLVAASRATTCRQTPPGTVIDYFLVGAAMLPRIRRPEVVEAADAKPHLPVTMPVAIQECPVMLRKIQEAKEMPTTVKAGCSRFPCNWSVVREQIAHIESDDDLGSAWLQVVNTIELEIAGRHDIVGEHVLRYLTPSSVDMELV
eukprot:594655-Pyramimonas_sp.AAC.1